MSNVVDLTGPLNVRRFAGFLRSVGHARLADRVLGGVARHEGLGLLDAPESHRLPGFQIADEVAIPHGKAAEFAPSQVIPGAEGGDLAKDGRADFHVHTLRYVLRIVKRDTFLVR